MARGEDADAIVESLSLSAAAVGCVKKRRRLCACNSEKVRVKRRMGLVELGFVNCDKLIL